MTLITKDIQTHWRVVRPIFSIRNENEYDLAIERLNALLDEVGNDEKHPLYGLVDTLGTVIHAYEEQHHAMPDCSGIEVLQFLMEEHELRPSDLPELGDVDVISAILSGQQELTVRDLQLLATRFQVSPAVFV